MSYRSRSCSSENLDVSGIWAVFPKWKMSPDRSAYTKDPDNFPYGQVGSTKDPDSFPDRFPGMTVSQGGRRHHKFLQFEAGRQNAHMEVHPPTHTHTPQSAHTRTRTHTREREITIRTRRERIKKKIITHSQDTRWCITPSEPADLPVIISAHIDIPWPPPVWAATQNGRRPLSAPGSCRPPRRTPHPRPAGPPGTVQRWLGCGASHGGTGGCRSRTRPQRCHPGAGGGGGVEVPRTSGASFYGSALPRRCCE